MPLGSRRKRHLSKLVSQYIDDIAGASDENSDSDHTLSEHESDRLFIDNSSEPATFSDSELRKTDTMDDDSDLSVLSQDEGRVHGEDKEDSDSEVVIVSTPSKTRSKKTTKRRRESGAKNTDDEAAAIKPGDSMFNRKNGVKASTLPPAMSTRRSVRGGNAAATVHSQPQVDVSPSSETVGESFPLASSTDEVGSPVTQNTALGPSGSEDDAQSRDDVLSPGAPTVGRSPSASAGQPIPTNLEHSSSSTIALLPVADADRESAFEKRMESRLEAMMLRFMSRQGPSMASAVETGAGTALPPATASPVMVAPQTVAHSSSDAVDVDTSVATASEGSVIGVANGGTSGAAHPQGPAPQAVNSPPSAANALAFPFNRIGVVNPGATANMIDPRTPPPSGSKRVNLQSPFVPTSRPGAGPSPVAIRDLGKGKNPEVGTPPSSNAAKAAMNNLFANKRKPENPVAVGDSSQNADGQAQLEDGPANPKKPRVLDDQLTFRVNYTPPAVCEVSYDELQDDAIKHIYDNLPNLPGDRRILPSFDRNPHEGSEGTIGGHLSFGVWQDGLEEASGATIYNAMTFTQANDTFVNPIRCSPGLMRLKQAAFGTSPSTYRLSIGNHAAICVSAGMCMESYIMEPTQSGGNPPRLRKYISLLLHNQDWERWESFLCVCFGQYELYAQITAKAVNMTTRLGQPDPAKQASAAVTYGNKPLFSYVRSPKKLEAQRKPEPASSQYSTSYSLKYDDIIPVYDARHREFDFDTELPSLATALPRWTGGEIPIGSFIVVGYTVASYLGKAQGQDGKVLHIGNNILWAIVCGTPRRRDD